MNVGKSVKVSQIHQRLTHMPIEINYTGWWYCKRLWITVIYYYLTCSSISFFYYHGLGRYMRPVMQQFSRFCFLKNWDSSCDQSCVAGFIVYERLHHFFQSHHYPYRHILFKPDSYQVMIPSKKLFVYGTMWLVLCPPTNLDLLREDFMSFFGLLLSLKTYLFVLLVIDD